MTEQSTPGLVEALWRYRWSSALVVLVLVSLSVAAGLLSGPAATVTAQISLTPPGPGNVLAPGAQGDASSARYTAERAAFVTSDAVLAAVSGRTGAEDTTQLRRDVVAEAQTGANTVLITVSAGSPDAAVDLASAVVASYAEQTEQEVGRLTQAALASLAESEAETLSSLDGVFGSGADAVVGSAATTLSDLRLQASELRTSSALFGDGVAFVEAPQVDAVETRGLPLREGALGLVVGLVAAGVIAWMRADRNRRVGTPEDVDVETDAPFLGELRHRVDRDVRDVSPLDALPTQSHRVVGASVGRELDSGVLVVTSDDPELRSATTLNLAASLAREGRRVLVVDGDSDGAHLTHGLALQGVRPWTAAPGGVTGTDGELGELVTSGGRAVAVAVAGTDGATLTLDELDAVVRTWRHAFDTVLVDLPPVTSGQLTTDLAGAADGGVLVVAHGTDTRELQEVLRQWGALGTPLLGYVYAASTTRRRRLLPVG